MAGSIWAIVIPRNAKQAPHTEERLPEGNDEPAGETAAGGRRLYWISAPVNPPVWTMLTIGRERRARCWISARQVIGVGNVSRQRTN